MFYIKMRLQDETKTVIYFKKLLSSFIYFYFFYFIFACVAKDFNTSLLLISLILSLLLLLLFLLKLLFDGDTQLGLFLSPYWYLPFVYIVILVIRNEMEIVQ